MKIQQEKIVKFSPITVTFETPEEFLVFWNGLNYCGKHPVTLHGIDPDTFDNVKYKMFSKIGVSGVLQEKCGINMEKTYR